MSETHRQRGTLVPGTIPFTAEEDELVQTLPTAPRPPRLVPQAARSLVAEYPRAAREAPPWFLVVRHPAGATDENPAGIWLALRQLAASRPATVAKRGHRASGDNLRAPASRPEACESDRRKASAGQGKAVLFEVTAGDGGDG